MQGSYRPRFRLVSALLVAIAAGLKAPGTGSGPSPGAPRWGAALSMRPLGTYVTYSQRARERAESFMLGLCAGLALGLALAMAFFRLGMAA
jgi:hypothetical protein